jgi:hypothetical protein
MDAKPQLETYAQELRQEAAEHRQAATESTSFNELHGHESQAVAIQKLSDEVCGNAGIISKNK